VTSQAPDVPSVAPSTSYQSKAFGILQRCPVRDIAYRHALPPPQGAGEEAGGPGGVGATRRDLRVPPRSPPPKAIPTTVHSMGAGGNCLVPVSGTGLCQVGVPSRFHPGARYLFQQLLRIPIPPVFQAIDGAQQVWNPSISARELGAPQVGLALMGGPLPVSPSPNGDIHWKVVHESGRPRTGWKHEGAQNPSQRNRMPRHSTPSPSSCRKPPSPHR